MYVSRGKASKNHLVLDNMGQYCYWIVLVGQLSEKLEAMIMKIVRKSLLAHANSDFMSVQRKCMLLSLAGITDKHVAA